MKLDMRRRREERNNKINEEAANDSKNEKTPWQCILQWYDYDSRKVPYLRQTIH